MIRRTTVLIAALSIVITRPSRADSGLNDATWEPESSGVAPADETPPEPRDPRALDPRSRALAVAIAVGPGAVVHGAGHWALGRPKTAARLALIQGAGLGGMVVGLAGLAVTGASRYVVAPLALATIAGAGLFALPWLADIYGSAALPDGASAAPTRAPVLISELGHRYVWDAQFRYRHFLVQGADLRFSRLRLAQSGWFALDDDNARMRLLVAHRLSGPTPDEVSADGSFLDLEAALTHHRFDSDGFRSLTGEVSLNLRRDLAGMDRALGGSFVEAGAGLALQRFEYRVPGVSIDADTNDLLLARFAFGFYLGEAGEAQLYYDHRHDDFAAGLELTGLGSGVAGHFGADARWFWGQWGVRAEGQVGSAWLGGLSLMFRQE